jgi:DNA-binding SARP family transcriptional activator/DNA-binding beta-propeller fold protein YncE
VSFRLVTFGELSLYHAGTSDRIALPRKALGILALLSASGGRPVSRDRIAALLWPEAGGPGASGRGALKQTIYQLRQLLGTADVVTGSADLSLDAALLSSDVADLESAHAAKDSGRVVALYQGAFMDGFQLRDSLELDHWLDARRAQYARTFRDAIEQLAADAARRGDHAEHVTLLRRLASHVPLDGRVALALIEALAGAGDRPGALAHYQLHERMLREQLDVAPEPAVTEAVERLRRSMPPAVPQKPRPVPPAGVAIAPARRPALARFGAAGAALAIPTFALAAMMLARTHARVIDSIPLQPTAGVRLNMLAPLHTVYLDGGASFEADLLSLHTAASSPVRVGTGSGMVADPTTHWIWSGHYGLRTVIVRNGRTNAEIGRIPVPGCPHSFAMAGEWVWVAQQCDDHISIIDKRQRRAIRHIPVPTLSREEVGGAKGMGDIFVNRATGVAYFSKDDIPHRLDPKTWEMRETPDFNGHVIGINEIANRLYVRIEHGIRIFDGATEKLVAEVPLSATPGQVAVGLAGDRVFIATHAGLVALDGRTNRVLYEAPLGRGFRPDAIAVDAGRRRAYLAGTEPDGSRALKVVELRD